MLLQLLLLYPELKSTQCHFYNLVAKILFLCQKIYQFFLKFVCLKSHFSLVRSLIASSATTTNHRWMRWMTPASCGLFHTKKAFFYGNSSPLFSFWGHQVADRDAAVDSSVCSPVECFLFSIREILVN